MDFSDYDSLLDRAYSQLPEKTKTSARFEMPQVDVLMEGNKTILKNFVFVAKAFDREEAHLQKFLTKELGSYSVVSGDRLVFNKKLFGKKIGDAVKRYAADYVLCPQCGKPDTHFNTMEGVKILKCEACGAWKPVKHI
jgi:translation initiation factor 2 subunit 2